jgi:hypothetical protein
MAQGLSLPTSFCAPRLAAGCRMRSTRHSCAMPAAAQSRNPLQRRLLRAHSCQLDTVYGKTRTKPHAQHARYPRANNTCIAGIDPGQPASSILFAFDQLLLNLGDQQSVSRCRGVTNSADPRHIRHRHGPLRSRVGGRSRKGDHWGAQSQSNRRLRAGLRVVGAAERLAEATACAGTHGDAVGVCVCLR